MKLMVQKSVVAAVELRLLPDTTMTLQVMGMEAEEGEEDAYISTRLLNINLRNVSGKRVALIKELLVAVVCEEGEENNIRYTISGEDLLRETDELCAVKARVGDPVQFPYKSAQGPALQYEHTTSAQHRAKRQCTGRSRRSGQRRLKCLFGEGCRKQVQLREMRKHVARHLLKKFPGVVQGAPGESVPEDVCGSCGRRGQCAVKLWRNAKEKLVVQQAAEHVCPLFFKFQYKAGERHCSNVPIVCSLCPNKDDKDNWTTVWRWGLRNHIELQHAGAPDDERRQLLAENAVPRAEAEDLLNPTARERVRRRTGDPSRSADAAAAVSAGGVGGAEWAAAQTPSAASARSPAQCP